MKLDWIHRNTPGRLPRKTNHIYVYRVYSSIWNCKTLLSVGIIPYLHLPPLPPPPSASVLPFYTNDMGLNNSALHTSWISSFEFFYSIFVYFTLFKHNADVRLHTEQQDFAGRINAYHGNPCIPDFCFWYRTNTVAPNPLPMAYTFQYYLV